MKNAKKHISASQFSFDKKNHAEQCKGASKTIAGEAYTIPELYAKYAKGIAVPIERKVYWSEEEEDFDAIDIESVMRSDMAEREMLLEEVVDRAEKYKLALERQRKEKAEAEEAEAKKSGEKSGEKKGDEK